MGNSEATGERGRISVTTDGGVPISFHYADLDLLRELQGTWFKAGTIPDEHSRAARFIKPEHQQRFLAARYFLRQVLAEYTGETAADIRIAFSEQEKPYLADHVIPFNLSHSGRFAVAGVTTEGELGVDIETRSSIKTAIQVAPRIMTEREHQNWLTIPEDGKMDAFLRYWTLKEAILKAHGDGLLQDPRGVDVDFGESGPEIAALKPVFGQKAWWRVGFVEPPAPFPRIAWALRI